VTEAFWNSLRQLVVHSEVVIDRAKGSVHPRYADMIYPLNYGYLAGTTASDGAGIDVWLGSSGGREVTGVIIAVDSVKRDSEIKICIGCTPDELQTILQFLSDNRIGWLLVEPTG